MKGARGTLAQGSGNSADQSMLLLALLRSSNIPARYVTGVIEYPAEQINEMLGVGSVDQAMLALARAGVARQAVIAGGKVSAIQIEATWVSAQIPYGNYRGATVDDSGKAWLALMPFVKAHQNELKPSLLVASGQAVEALQNDFLQTLQESDVLATLRDELAGYLRTQNSEESYEERLSSHTVSAEAIGYVPNTLPISVVAVTHESSELPDELVHKVRVYARSNTDAVSDVIMDVTRPLYELASRQISLSYQAATQADHNLALSMGGIGSVPLHMLSLRPLIKVQGETITVAQRAVGAGQAHSVYVDIVSPNGSHTVQKTVFAGGFHALGIAAQDATVDDNSLDFSDDDPNSTESRAGRILSQIALRYLDDWSNSELELANLSARTLLRPEASVVFVSNELNVESLLGVPQRLNWRGVSIDAIFRPTNSVAHHAQSVSDADFLRLSGLQGSYLEHDVFERYFSIESISADKGLAIAHAAGNTVELINQANVAERLASLNHSDAVKDDIAGWVSRGFDVRVPQSEIALLEWQGSVWLVQDPLTGHAGYFIARGLAGGASAEMWPESISDVLANPDIDGINDDPDSAANIYLLPSSDQQISAAGTKSEPMVVLVTDRANRLVKNARVTFSVQQTNSGGELIGVSEVSGEEENAKTITVLTNARGEARVTYQFPEVVDDSYTIQFSNLNANDEFATKIGLNYIKTVVQGSSGAPLTSSAYFTSFVTPDVATVIRRTPDDGGVASLQGRNNTGHGLLWMVVEDQYGNRVANSNVSIVAGDVIFSSPNRLEARHTIRSTEPTCNLVPTPDSCFVSQDTRKSSALGRVYLFIKFGRVITPPDPDEPIKSVNADYPVSVTLQGANTLNLDYRTIGDTRFSGLLVALIWSGLAARVSQPRIPVIAKS